MPAGAGRAASAAARGASERDRRECDRGSARRRDGAAERCRTAEPWRRLESEADRRAEGASAATLARPAIFSLGKFKNTDPKISVDHKKTKKRSPGSYVASVFADPSR